MSSGLGFAQINDPASGVTVPAVGQFFLMMATLIFLSIDGHLMMFEIIIRSFDTLPVSTNSLPLESIAELISFGSLMFSAGLDSYILKRLYKFRNDECLFVRLGTKENKIEEELIDLGFPGVLKANLPVAGFELPNKIIPFRNYNSKLL